MSELKGTCIVGQSGGPTAVINSSILGVIRTALDADCITRVLGAAHGIKGVLDDKLYDMGVEDAAELELLKYTPLLRPGLLPVQAGRPRCGRDRLQADSGDLQEVRCALLLL